MFRTLALFLLPSCTPLLAQEFIDLPWRLSEQGRLEVRELSDNGGTVALQFGDWVPMFPRLFERTPSGDWAGGGYGWGPFLLLPLIVHGDGGAAALDEAALRLHKLSLGVTFLSAALMRLRPDPLVDLLRIRHLAALDVLEADMALRDYARDAQRDPFVRAAAVRAFVERETSRGERVADDLMRQVPQRNGTAALHAGLARAPDDADLLIGILGAAMPGPAPLLAAWRTAMIRFASAVCISAGGSMTSAQLSIGQIAADRPGQLPYELATIFGNWRVDHALFAMRHGETDHWWFHLGGAFQPQRIAAGMQAAGGEAAIGKDGELRGTLLDWEVRATATELEAWPAEMAVGTRGARVAELHDRAAPGRAPAWLLIPAMSRLGVQLGLEGSDVDVQLQMAPRRLSARARCLDATRAERVLARWRAWQGTRSCNPGDKVPGQEVTWGDAGSVPPGAAEDRHTRLFWRRCVQAVRATQDGSQVDMSLDLGGYSLVDLVRLLSDSPLVVLRDG